MATRIGSAARQVVFRRFSSGGKVLSEEEKAAENVYIKKVEQEKLQKLARKGPTEETTASGSGGSPTDGKASAAASSTPTGASTEKVSTDQHRNYAVIAGSITALGALGWYLKSRGKKQEETQD